MNPRQHRHVPIAMLLWLSLCAAALWALPATGASADGLADGERGKPEAGACVQSKAEARYSGYGYDHLVHLDNRCETAMHCKVTTNVNPKGVEADVAKGGQTTVLTFRGSPASSFEHEVECKAK